MSILRELRIIRRLALATALSPAAILVLPFSSHAYQPDGPHATHAKKNAAKWAEEDKKINAKLAALEKRSGKKPT